MQDTELDDCEENAHKIVVQNISFDSNFAVILGSEGGLQHPRATRTVSVPRLAGSASVASLLRRLRPTSAPQGPTLGAKTVLGMPAELSHLFFCTISRVLLELA